MGKWFDANGVDIDAYPDRAFQGGVYNGGILGGYKPTTMKYEARDAHGQDENTKVDSEKADVQDGSNT